MSFFTRIIGPTALACLSMSACNQRGDQFDSFDKYPIYKGSDLGLSKTVESYKVKVYAPTADELVLKIYNHATDGELVHTIDMEYGVLGVWQASIPTEYAGQYYVYQAKFEGHWNQEVNDPYTRMVGVNGLRSYIGMIEDVAVEGFDQDYKPDFHGFDHVILYETHVRDITQHPNSKAQHPGKFKGLSESGLRFNDELSTGLDHIAEMGVTHVHLLPFFDFKSVDEAHPEKNEYNWGYDPLNYFGVEGSYSTDPENPEVRVRELKELIMAMHQKGLRVVMDVVFNHTAKGWDSNFNQLVPNYYYRLTEDSTFSNASACGNETASNHPMYRKYMVDAIKYWVNEFHIDGFRFDLMGIHDIETMNQIRKEVDAIDSTIVIYGEGWAPSDSPYPFEKRALKHNMQALPGIAAFNDELRDAVKGPWNNHEEKGFVAGKIGLEESIRFGLAGSAEHPQIRLKRVNYSNAFWASEPKQSVIYVSCHDDLTLYDKWARSCPECSDAEYKRMQALALGVVLTSQGIPFLHAGSEFMRSKQGVDDSYKSPDSVNAIDWSYKAQHEDLVNFTKGLIQIRKTHPGLRLPDRQAVAKHLEFLERNAKGLVAFRIKGRPAEETWEDITVIFNGQDHPQSMDLPEGRWKCVVKGLIVNANGIETRNSGTIEIPAKTMLMFHKI